MRGSQGLVALVLIATSLAGCLATQAPVTTQSALDDVVKRGVAVAHDALGRILEHAPPGTDLSRLSSLVFSVGQPGAEPSVGVASDGTIFFQASERTVRSRDHGRTWQQLAGPFLATGSSDPYLWVDPVTERVFQINQGIPFGGRGPYRTYPIPSQSPVTVSTVPNALFCAHIAWSDDGGSSWLANPIDCGPVPGVDHIKLATGPWVGELADAGESPIYPNAVYFAYNKAFATGVGVRNGPSPDSSMPELGGWMTVSFDGGTTFPHAAQMFPATCTGGLHGNIAVALDGAIYVPARNCPAPLVAYSFDNGRTWENVIVGESVGVPEQQKNPEMAVDRDGNVFLAWVGADNRLFLSVSRDRAQTWSAPVVASSPRVGSAIWPVMVAGDAGRIGIAYVGTEDSPAPAWEVANETRWHLYYTYSLDALDGSPEFVTIRATDDADPVQRGTVCVQSDKCKDGNRNLLDFIDIALDIDGRPYVAFADGCTTPQCLRDDANPLDSRDREGAVMILMEGPSLLAEKGQLGAFGG